MSRHRIARAAPRPDFTVDLEWTDGRRSVADVKPFIAAGGLMESLGDPTIFLRRMYIHAEGESLAWEVYGQLVDFQADNLWRDSREQPAAAE